MKLFSEYVSSSILENHFKLEFEIKEETKYTININEKFGSYNGQIDLAKYITNYIFKKTKLSKCESIKYILKRNYLKHFENIFFEELIIIYNTTCNSYYDLSSKYNNDTKLFNQIKIYINNEENKTYNDILVSVVHELTHAWEDYNRRIKDDKLSLYNLTNTTNYKELISHINSFNDFSDLCAKILYMFKGFEKNAYLSELSCVLTDTDKKINNYKDALNIFYKTNTFQEYYILYEAFKKFYNEHDFVNYYQKNVENITANKIFKKLNNQFIKVFNKISSIVPKIFYNYCLNKEEQEKNNKLIKPFSAFNEQLILLLNI